MSISTILNEFYRDMKAYESLDGKEYEEARDRAYERAEQAISLVYAQLAPTLESGGELPE